MRRTFEAATAEEAAELLSRLYARVRLTVRDGRGGLTLSQHTFDGVELSRATHRMTAEVVSEPLGSVVITRIRSGRIRAGDGNTAHVWQRGDVYARTDPAAPQHVELTDADCDFAVLDPQLLTDLVAGPDGTGAAVRLLDPRPVSPAAATRWTRTYATVRDLVAFTPMPLSALAAGQAARLLAAVALSTFPSTAATEATAGDRHDGHPPTLRRAIAFIEANPDLDLGVADIARSAFVTPRALQLAFRRHLDTTPLAYLRQVRLDQARRDLQAAGRGDTTVTAVAMRWGFADPGNFTQHYRRTFGELPSRTLDS